MKFILSIALLSSLLLSCSTHKEPQLIELSYQFFPAIPGLPSEKNKLNEGIYTPEGLYDFIADENTPKSLVIVDFPFEVLSLRFDNSKRITLYSSSHLFGIDIISDEKKDIQFDIMFSELIRMNITEQQLVNIQSTAKPSCIATAPKLINKEEIIKINNADGQRLIGYTVFMNIPKKYQKKKIVGSVRIEGMVNKSGRLVNSRIIENTGSEVLESAAIELVEKLLFEPATIDCEIDDFEGFFIFNFIQDDSIEMKN